MFTTAGLAISARRLKLSGALKVPVDFAWATGLKPGPFKTSSPPHKIKKIRKGFTFRVFLSISIAPMIELISFPELVKNRRWAHRSIARFNIKSDINPGEVSTGIQPKPVGYKKLNLFINS